VAQLFVTDDYSRTHDSGLGAGAANFSQEMKIVDFVQSSHVDNVGLR
jgi:hypothetical protein